MGQIILEEQASPSTSAANKVTIYPKAGGGLYRMNDSGIEYEFRMGSDLYHSGSGTFNSTSGSIVTIGSTLSTTSYNVVITPIGADAAALDSIGAIGVSGKTTTEFTVYNLGAETSTAFDWVLIDKE